MAIDKDELRSTLSKMSKDELIELIGVSQDESKPKPKRNRRGKGNRKNSKEKVQKKEEAPVQETEDDNEEEVIYTKSKKKRKPANSNRRGGVTCRREPFNPDPNREVMNYNDLFSVGSLSAGEKKELKQAEELDKIKRGATKGKNEKKVRKKTKMLKIECEDCGRLEKVSPSLVRRDSEGDVRFKCNSCSIGAKI